MDMRKFRRLLALLMLVCMPMQALSALDGVLCKDQGFGDSGAAFALESGSNHDHVEIGEFSVDSCALCHLGCVPPAISLASQCQTDLKQTLVSKLDDVCIEHSPFQLKRPPRFPFA
jgi:hypothetical protein